MADGAVYGVGEMSDRSAQDIVHALKALSASVAAAQSFDAILPIRARQIEYLKATNKFPESSSFTPLVLRPDVTPSFISTPYHAR